MNLTADVSRLSFLSRLDEEEVVALAERGRAHGVVPLEHR